MWQNQPSLQSKLAVNKYRVNSADLQKAWELRSQHCRIAVLQRWVAPVHKFPGAGNDAWDALVWLSGYAEMLGLDARRLAVGGDSAGRNAGNNLRYSGARCRPSFSLQLLIYLGYAPHQYSDSHGGFNQGFVLKREQIDRLFDH